MAKGSGGTGRGKSGSNIQPSRGEQLRSKYKDLADNFDTTSSDKQRIKASRAARVRKRISDLTEVRKTGLVTRDEASDSWIQKSFDRRARKLGRDVSVTRAALDDSTMKDVRATTKKTFRGSATRGGSAERRAIGRLKKNPRSSSVDPFL